MKLSLFITVIVFLVFIAGIIIYLMKKDKISIKYSILWLLTIVLAFIVLIIPNLLEFIFKILGFELVSNMVLCIFIVILLLISIAQTVMTTNQIKKITLLVQEVGIMKKKLEDLK